MKPFCQDRRVCPLTAGEQARRTELFLGEVSRSRTVWMLTDRQDDPFTVTRGNRRYICLWPTAEAARDFARENLPRRESWPCPIPLGVFLDTTRRLSRDKTCRYALCPEKPWPLSAVRPQALWKALTR